MQCDLERLLEDVRTKPAGFPDVRSLCRASGLDITAFSAAFLDSMHLSPALFLKRTRVEAAARLLLESTRRIANIAADVGFDSETAFQRHFLAHTGLAPSAYRALRQ